MSWRSKRPLQGWFADPRLRRRKASAARFAPKRRVAVALEFLLVAATALPAGDWPQFLGPGRNGVYDGGDLRDSWGEKVPTVLWERSIGQGFSAPVVAGGKLILFHRLGDKETVDCLDAESGKSIWSFDYPTAYDDDFGFDEGPRATPAIDGGRVYTFGAEGWLHCLDLEAGKRLWSADTRAKFKAPKGFFGAACSPLVEGGKVLLNAGGAEGAGIVAFDAATGGVAWTATSDGAGYSSPVAAAFGGKRLALFFTRAGLAGIEPDRGEVRFQFPWRAKNNASVNAATPLVAGDLVFISASYQTGAALLRVREEGVEKVWAGDDILSNHYATSVLHQGFLYGFDGRQEYGPRLRSVEMKSGKVMWTKEGLGAGTLTLAGERLLLVLESGDLVLAQAAPDGYLEKARTRALAGTVRAHPALAGGRLYARNEKQLVCIDLRAPR